ncbi:MAG: hypothetical protein DRI48_11450, partial [Chloroflexi bacterium]
MGANTSRMDEVCCSSCGFRNRPSWRVCHRCGAPLHRQSKAVPVPQSSPPSPLEKPSCPRCGHSNRSGARYCNQCGTSLTPPVLEDTQPIPAPTRHSQPQSPLPLARSSMRPQPAAQGSAAVGAFAAMICFLDGLLLLGVAFTQLAAGGLGILVGLWNLAVTLAYAAAALGLARQEDWGYRWGLRLAVTNVGLLFAQATFWGAVGASEEAVERYRAERCAASPQNVPSRPGRLGRILRWLTPNRGTLL